MKIFFLGTYTVILSVLLSRAANCNLYETISLLCLTLVIAVKHYIRVIEQTRKQKWQTIKIKQTKERGVIPHDERCWCAVNRDFPMFTECGRHIVPREQFVYEMTEQAIGVTCEKCVQCLHFKAFSKIC